MKEVYQSSPLEVVAEYQIQKGVHVYKNQDIFDVASSVVIKLLVFIYSKLWHLQW